MSEYSSKTKKWINKKMLKLTFRERVLLMLNQLGLVRKEKADALFVSEKTIKNCNSNLVKKINVKNIALVEKYASTHRLIY